MISRREVSLRLGAFALVTFGIETFGLVKGTTAVYGADEPPPSPKKKKKMPPRDLPDTPLEKIPNHRQLMRDIVLELSRYAKGRRADFSVLARDAPELLIKEKREWNWQSARDPDGVVEGKYTPIGTIDSAYLNAVDGFLLDGLTYGYDTFDQASDPDDSGPLLAEGRAARRQSRRLFTIDYCHAPKAHAAALKAAQQLGAVAFIDGEPSRALNVIGGMPINENAAHVDSLGAVRNFLPLLENASFASRDTWVQALTATNDDLLMLNPFWRGNVSLTKADVTALKFKRIGVNRLVFAVLPVGYADVGSYYWNWSWRVGNPSWLDAPDPDVTDRIIVQFWDPAWKEMIGKTLAGLMDLGFDGVVLDALDSYLHFEALMPL